jgi:GT2 family glycosyltransferase
VIPTCGRGALLREAIASIAEQTRCEFEVIVVDGASRDETAEVLRDAHGALGSRLRVIREEKREGFTKAVNKGFRAAKGRYLTWLNDDARPVGDSLNRAVVQLEDSPADVGLLAMFHRCTAIRSVAYATTRHGTEFKLMHVRGTLYANFGMGRRSLFERLGFFDERFVFYGGDPDFSLKVWDAGLRVVPAYGSLIDHEQTEDQRRADDVNVGKEDNERLFAKWDLPKSNPRINDFDPTCPCTLRGLRTVAEAA